MQAVTITQITPDELQLLIEKSLTKIIKDNRPENRANENTWFDIEELCSYHPDKPARQTVYAWVNSRSIPHHKGAKKLRFLKSEIDAWLKQGKQKTIAEIKATA